MKIPTISDKKLNDLYQRIKPVGRYALMHLRGGPRLEKHQDGEFYFLKDVHPRKVAFSWDPTPDTKAVGLIELDSISTYHTYGYHGFFKPSVAEVISQIPEEYLETAVAFETDYLGMSGKYHEGRTTLYRYSTIDEMNNQIKELEEAKNNLESKLKGESQ